MEPLNHTNTIHLSIHDQISQSALHLKEPTLQGLGFRLEMQLKVSFSLNEEEFLKSLSSFSAKEREEKKNSGTASRE